ncbi:uncharacterized protein LOC108705622 [Xenopus laevis]|uniref:Uncharacterized protein LOC108705622 n=1 Tax=Xenopus laevis TaxID=8355 RepID=A0A8J1L6Q8_XENLA|nr:uncharacterized protein LOC108705622 [Xenopus laevis]
MRSWGSLMDLQNGEEAKGIEPSAKDWRPKLDLPNSKVEEEANYIKSDQAPVIKSWRSRGGEKAERESLAKDKRPEIDHLVSKVKEEENDNKTDPASVRSSGSVKDMILEKEQEVETDNIDMEKADVLPTKGNTDPTKSEDKGAVEKKTISKIFFFSNVKMCLLFEKVGFELFSFTSPFTHNKNIKNIQKCPISPNYPISCTFTN